ncbi:MAG: TrbC/VirB2 family protein [Clostridia bacterium]
MKRKKKNERKIRRKAAIAAVAATLTIIPEAAMAEGGDPIAVVNNFSDFMFALVRAFGMILIGFGIVQVGLSLKSHDPSQRANGIMTVAGGIIITFAKEILTLITG